MRLSIIIVLAGLTVAPQDEVVKTDEAVRRIEVLKAQLEARLEEADALHEVARIQSVLLEKYALYEYRDSSFSTEEIAQGRAKQLELEWRSHAFSPRGNFYDSHRYYLDDSIGYARMGGGVYRTDLEDLEQKFQVWLQAEVTLRKYLDKMIDAEAFRSALTAKLLKEVERGIFRRDMDEGIRIEAGERFDLESVAISEGAQHYETLEEEVQELSFEAYYREIEGIDRPAVPVIRHWIETPQGLVPTSHAPMNVPFRVEVYYVRPPKENTVNVTLTPRGGQPVNVPAQATEDPRCYISPTLVLIPQEREDQ
jgi:hypothetical protein